MERLYSSLLFSCEFPETLVLLCIGYRTVLLATEVLVKFITEYCWFNKEFEIRL